MSSDVVGRCPACGVASLFLTVNGYVCCRVEECPDPGAPSDLLENGASERGILTDLIAELRELATCDIDLGNQTDPETLAFLLDRAEARLREVGDE